MSSSTNLRTQPTTQYYWGMKKEKSHNLLGRTLYAEELTLQIRDVKILSKIKLHMFKNQDYSCCKAWLVKKGSHIHISTKIFKYSLRLQNLSLRKASGIYTIWSPPLRESSPGHPSMALTSHRSHWTMVSFISSHVMQHISCSREHSDNVPKHALEHFCLGPV